MSAQKTILVTGATGNQGGGVVRHCLNHGHRVVALVRDPDAEAAKKLKQLGAELSVGTFDDMDSLRAAMQDVDAVFTTEIRTHDSALDLQRVTNVINTALASPRVNIFVVSTAYKTGSHESFPGWGPDYDMRDYWLQKDAIEKLVRNAGFKHWLILRPAHFLQNLKAPISKWCFTGLTQEDRTIRTAWKPDTRVSLLDVEDVGIPTALAVSEPKKYHGRSIDLGAEAITIEQLAGKLGKVAGEEVKVRYMTEEEANEAGKTNPAIRSQRWANSLPDQDVTTEFEMTSVEDYIARNKGDIF